MERSLEQPPPWVVEAARVCAMESPCQKSKRGAAVYAVEDCDEILDGRARDRAEYFGRPYDEARCQEQSIVEVAHNAPPTGWSCTGSEACRKNCGKLCRHAEERAIHAAGVLASVETLAMVHVKVVDGQVVAGGPPSCWQCSRLVADCGIRGIWLYERGLSDNERDDGSALTAVAIEEAPAWRFYNAADFHRRTLEHEGLAELGAERPPPDHIYTIGTGDGCSLCDRPIREHVR